MHPKGGHGCSKVGGLDEGCKGGVGWVWPMEGKNCGIGLLQSLGRRIGG